MTLEKTFLKILYILILKNISTYTKNLKSSDYIRFLYFNDAYNTNILKLKNYLNADENICQYEAIDAWDNLLPHCNCFKKMYSHYDESIQKIIIDNLSIVNNHCEYNQEDLTSNKDVKQYLISLKEKLLFNAQLEYNKLLNITLNTFDLIENKSDRYSTIILEDLSEYSYILSKCVKELMIYYTKKLSFIHKSCSDLENNSSYINEILDKDLINYIFELDIIKKNVYNRLYMSALDLVVFENLQDNAKCSNSLDSLIVNNFYLKEYKYNIEMHNKCSNSTFNDIYCNLCYRFKINNCEEIKEKFIHLNNTFKEVDAEINNKNSNNNFIKLNDFYNKKNNYIIEINKYLKYQLGKEIDLNLIINKEIDFYINISTTNITYNSDNNSNIQNSNNFSNNSVININKTSDIKNNKTIISNNTKFNNTISNETDNISNLTTNNSSNYNVNSSDETTKKSIEFDIDEQIKQSIINETIDINKFNDIVIIAPESYLQNILDLNKNYVINWANSNKDKYLSYVKLIEGYTNTVKRLITMKESYEEKLDKETDESIIANLNSKIKIFDNQIKSINATLDKTETNKLNLESLYNKSLLILNVNNNLRILTKSLLNNKLNISLVKSNEYKSVKYKRNLFENSNNNFNKLNTLLYKEYYFNNYNFIEANLNTNNKQLFKTIINIIYKDIVSNRLENISNEVFELYLEFIVNINNLQLEPFTLYNKKSINIQDYFNRDVKITANKDKIYKNEYVYEYILYNIIIVSVKRNTYFSVLIIDTNNDNYYIDLFVSIFKNICDCIINNNNCMTVCPSLNTNKIKSSCNILNEYYLDNCNNYKMPSCNVKNIVNINCNYKNNEFDNNKNNITTNNVDNYNNNNIDNFYDNNIDSSNLNFKYLRYLKDSISLIDKYTLEGMNLNNNSYYSIKGSNPDKKLSNAQINEILSYYSAKQEVFEELLQQIEVDYITNKDKIKDLNNTNNVILDSKDNEEAKTINSDNKNTDNLQNKNIQTSNFNKYAGYYYDYENNSFTMKYNMLLFLLYVLIIY